MSTPAERRAARLREEYGDCLEDQSCAAVLDAPLPRFVLIQHNRRRDGNYWLAGCDSPEDAARYIDGDEYPEDWELENLIDLQTGKTYVSETRTVFTEAAETYDEERKCPDCGSIGTGVCGCGA